MILINFGIQDGEQRYTEYDWSRDYTQKDYDDGKVSDLTLIKNMYSVGDDDFDEDDPNSYWINGFTSLVWVESVKDITQKELDTMRKYV